jgi:20S proteasome alpha/beta subunit
MGFGATGKNNEVSPYIYKVNNDYVSIGSGSTYARLVLTQQDRLYSSINRKLSDLATANSVGIAAYIINEAKQLDLETGGKTQVAVVDRNGHRELAPDEQVKCHQRMTADLCTYLNEYFSNKDKTSEIIKYLFPYD